MPWRAAHLLHRFDVGHRDRLAAAGVVGDGQHDQRDLAPRPRAAIRRSSAATSMLPLKSSASCVSAASGIGRSTARAPVNSMLARVVSKCVFVGHHVPRLAHHREQDALGGAALVRGDHVAEAGQLVDHALQAEEALAAGVGFVAAHHRRPLLGGHGAGAGIGEQVDQDVAGFDQKEVVAGLLQVALALFAAWSGAAARRS